MKNLHRLSTRLGATLTLLRILLGTVTSIAALGQITSVDFSTTDVPAGVGSITATITMRNPVTVPITYYVEATARPEAGGGNLLFLPLRKVVTIPGVSAGTTDLIWNPPVNAAKGAYSFTCVLYRTADGTDFYDNDVTANAFTVSDPLTGQVGSVNFSPDPVQAGIETLTANIQVSNSGGASITYYVDAWVRPVSGSVGNIFFSPSRRPVTLGAGESTVVPMQWAVPINANKSLYNFTVRLFTAPDSTDFYAEQSVLSAFTVTDPLAGQVGDITFTPDPVHAGIETLTANIQVSNSGGTSITYYLDAWAWPVSGSVGNIFFSPSRRPVTLGAGESTVVPMQWAVPINASKGLYNFTARLFTAPDSTDFYADLSVTDAFTVADPISGSLGEVEFQPSVVLAGWETLSATVHIQNSGSVATRFYLEATARPAGDGTAGWIAFTPLRQEILIQPGSEGTATATWTSQFNHQLGNYDFRCQLFRTADGTDVFDDVLHTDAFSLADPFGDRGAIQVSLSPTAAALAGAKWRAGNGEWQDANATQTDLLPGVHYLEFLPVPGWDTPQSIKVDLQGGETFTTAATYSAAVQLRLNLSIAGNGTLLATWAEPEAALILESTDRCGSNAQWQAVTGVSRNNGLAAALVSANGSQSFFRLRVP